MTRPMRGIRPLVVAAALAAAASAALLGAPSGVAAPAPAVQLYSFGENYYGELGVGANYGTSNSNATPLAVNLPSLHPVLGSGGSSGAPVEIKAVALGNFHSLVLTSAGQLYAFGDNDDGQLGSPGNVGTNVGESTLTLVAPPDGQGFTQIAAGANHSLAVTSTGQLYAFGDNHDGQLGFAANTTTNPTPTLVRFPLLPDRPKEQPVITEVAAGANDSFALTSAGQLYSFGENTHGQLGTGTNFGNFEPTPTRVSLPGQNGTITRIAAGADYTFALTSTGQLYGFGNNVYGQLGLPTATTQTATPTQMELLQPHGAVTAVAAGGGQTLIVTSTGRLYSLGLNIYGQLGYATNVGTLTANPSPTPVTLAGMTGAVTQVGASGNSSFALTSTGQLYSFGVNYFGQLGRLSGRGTAAPNTNPEQVSLPGGATIETLARGSNATHMLVVVSDLAVSSDSLAAGHAGSAYSQNVTASGGAPPYSWSASGLPSGLSISASGTITGTPTAPTSAHVVLTVTDANGITASSAPLTLTIASTTSTTTTTTTTTTAVPGRASIGKVRSEAPKAVVVRVACAGSAGERCSGTLALSAVEHLRGSTVIAVSATKRRATRTVTLGRASYRLNAGATAAFTIKLDGTAQSLLSTHHHFAAKLTLTPGGAGSPTARRTITLRAS
jgi:alpha-tubulin suppressor-like RCC1 family protein